MRTFFTALAFLVILTAVIPAVRAIVPAAAKRRRFSRIIAQRRTGMTQEKGSSQMSSFLEPLFNRAVTLALLAIVIFLVIYVIAVGQRLRQNDSARDANEVRMAALEDANRKAATSEQEQADKLAALETQMGTFALAEDEAAQSGQITALAQQVEALNQQAATFAANDDAAQAGEAAQSEQRLPLFRSNLLP